MNDDEISTVLTLSFASRTRMVVEEPLQAPVTVQVDRPKSKKSKHVYIAQNRWSGERESITESPPEPNKLLKWYRRHRALKQIENEHKQDKKRLKEWEKWRQNEEQKIRNARIEKARIEREQEYLLQLIHLKKEKALLARKTLQTKYPFPTDHKEAIRRANEAFYEEKKSDKFRWSRQEPKPFVHTKPIKYEKTEIVEPVRIEKVEKVKPVKIKKVKKEKHIKIEKKKIKPQKELTKITEEVEIEPKKKEKKPKIFKTKVDTDYVTIRK